MTSDQGPSHQDVLSWGLTGHIPLVKEGESWTIYRNTIYLYHVYTPGDCST